MARKLLFPATILMALLGCVQDYDLGNDPPGTDDPIDDDDQVLGEGPWPDIKVEPTALSFGYLLPGCLSDEKTVTISNVGEIDLEISEINGPGAAAFDMDHDGGAETLAPGESITIELTFEADSLGDFTGGLEIKSNDPDEQTVDVDLEGHGSENPMQEDLFEQPIPDAVDVLWVIDNSCSMSGTVDDLSAELGTFIGNFTTLGLDYQLGVVTTDMDEPTDSGRLQGAGVMSPAIQGSDTAVQEAFKTAAAVGAGGSATERGRDAAYAALSSPLVNNENAGFVRTDAHLAIIVISDEEDSSNNISHTDFINWLDAYKGDPDKTSFSAMAGAESSSPLGLSFPSFDCGFTGGTATSSYYYPQVTHATEGLYTDLCDMDFDEVLTWLSFYAAGMSTKFCPSDPIVIPAGLKVEVDGNTVNRVSGPPPWSTGWNLGGDGCVEFFGSSIPGPGTEISLTYPTDATCD